MCRKVRRCKNWLVVTNKRMDVLHSCDNFIFTLLTPKCRSLLECVQFISCSRKSSKIVEMCYIISCLKKHPAALPSTLRLNTIIIQGLLQLHLNPILILIILSFTTTSTTLERSCPYALKSNIVCTFNVFRNEYRNEKQNWDTLRENR